MAVPVARVHLAMAHAALPGLLPTPPVPLLLITPPCAAAAILPNRQSLPNNKPGRADAADRWDACKIKKSTLDKKSSSNPTSRADAVDRWDAGKKMIARQASTPSSSSSSGSSSGQSSPDDKKSGSSSPASRAASMCQNQKRWDGNKRPVSRGSSSSSAERWDAHKKKPQPPHVFDVDDDGESSTGSNVDIMEVDDDDEPPQSKMTGAHYTGPGFLAPPEPSMLPTPPSFLLLPRPRLIVG